MNDMMLLIPHLKVQNANALSSPFTIGFPAMTAWLGAMHALQRKLNANGLNVTFDSVSVVSHQFELQTYKGPGDYEYSIVGTANPLDKDGKRPSFIEEARCHLDVSMVIRYSGIKKINEDEALEKISHCLNAQMKVAGGDILEFGKPAFFRDFDLVKPKLMPGYALIERRDLMLNAMKQGRDALDAMLDYLSVHHVCEKQALEGEEKVIWRSERMQSGPGGEVGWIVPIATGFQGISDLGIAENQRDPSTPHRFAEAVITLGEFKMAYRFDGLEDIEWRYHYNPESSLYLCQQDPIEGF